jgi:hypothetical protein
MKALLIGYGEVGQGIYEAWKDKHEFTIYDPDKGHGGFSKENHGEYDICLIAIPHSPQFINICKQWKILLDNISMVVFSSVPIGTCSQIPAVHSPIEGDHTNMAESIKKHQRWVGGYDDVVMDFFHQTCGFLGVVVLPKPEHTEFLKLRSTTIYGINIEFARYSKDVSQDIGLDYDWVKKYDRDYNRLLKNTDRPDLQRPALDPPEGKIGGHCVIPNARLLQNTYPGDLVKVLLDHNKEDENHE